MSPETQNKTATEPVKVKMSSVTCTKCRLPHTLNTGGLCEFCSRPDAPASAKWSNQAVLVVVLGVAAVLWAFLIVVSAATRSGE